MPEDSRTPKPTREQLGMEVLKGWAAFHPDTSASEWGDLSPTDQAACMLIGQNLYQWGFKDGLRARTQVAHGQADARRSR